jgi:hypothetical protein
MQLPLAYLDRAAIEEVSIDLWKDVFNVVGWPSSLTSKRDSFFAHDEIVSAFAKDELTDSLLQALEALHSFGSEEGREAIMTAMQDRSAGALPAGNGDREFALRFFVAQRKDASFADAFARAQIQIQEGGNPRRYNEFMGKEARSVKGLDRKKEVLREKILDFCEKSDLGNHVQVEAFEDDGLFVFNILRSHRTQKPLAVVPGHSARATIQFRPVHGDVIRYDAAVGRLRIAARASAIIDFYRELLGKVLFNDEAFFDGDPVCSLNVLQERGRHALDHEIYGIGRVRMTECLWERGDREFYHIRSNDCFRSMEELNLPLSEGRLLQAKLKCEVIGKSTRPVTVNIRVPSRIEVSQKIHEDLIDTFLDATGIRNAAAGSSTINLWTLYPWRHSVDTWRSLFGAETDKLVREQVLKPIQLAAVPHPDHLEAGRVLDVHAVSNGDYYGVSRAEEIPSRSLTATDLDGLELQPEQLRIHLRKRLGMTNGGVRWDNGELLDLGFLEVGGHRIYAVYALRQPRSGIGHALRARADGAHPVLLFPSPEDDGAELAHVTLESALPTKQELIRQAVCACALDGSVPALFTAPDGARLVVDTRLGKVWVDGVEIKGLSSDSQPYKFLVLMANSSTPVSRDEIVNVISPGRQKQDEDTAARQAKSRARELIAEAMAAVGRSFDEDPFPAAGRGLYRCAFLSHLR